MGEKRGEKFTVQYITRASIAEDLTDYLEASDGEFAGCARFEPDDARLSDAICAAFARELGVTEDAEDTASDGYQNLLYQYLKKLCEKPHADASEQQASPQTETMLENFFVSEWDYEGRSQRQALERATERAYPQTGNLIWTELIHRLPAAIGHRVLQDLLSACPFGLYYDRAAGAVRYYRQRNGTWFDGAMVAVASS